MKQGWPTMGSHLNRSHGQALRVNSDSESAQEFRIKTLFFPFHLNLHLLMTKFFFLFVENEIEVCGWKPRTNATPLHFAVVILDSHCSVVPTTTLFCFSAFAGLRETFQRNCKTREKNLAIKTTPIRGELTLNSRSQDSFKVQLTHLAIKMSLFSSISKQIIISFHILNS